MKKRNSVWFNRLTGVLNGFYENSETLDSVENPINVPSIKRR